MSEVTTAPSPPVVERKCKLEEVFDTAFIELLRLVPKNPHVRALILKLTGKIPVPECDTFEQLKDWVEMNCEKRPKPVLGRVGRRDQNDGIAITVEFSEIEHGQANYSVPRSGSEEFRIGAGELMEVIQQAIDEGDGLDRIVEDLAEKIEEDAWGQCNPSMDDGGDYDYNDHECSETSDSETEYSREAIRRSVLAFVRERHPELAAEL